MYTVKLLAKRNRLNSTVRGTSRSCAVGPLGDLVRYSRNAAIKAPKNVDSLKMKAAMPTMGDRQVTSRACARGRSMACARSYEGRLLEIGGSATKFSTGGGDVVAHSSVHAFHGLSAAC